MMKGCRVMKMIMIPIREIKRTSEVSNDEE